MTPEEYCKKALRTEHTPAYIVLYEEVGTGLGGDANRRLSRLDHAVKGIVTEGGELTDALKRRFIYGKPLDTVNIIEELGDVCWYVNLAIDAVGTTWEDVWERNIAKLTKRFPDKFTADKALNRDLDAERAALEAAPTAAPTNHARALETIIEANAKIDQDNRKALTDALGIDWSRGRSVEEGIRLLAVRAGPRPDETQHKMSCSIWKGKACNCPGTVDPIPEIVRARVAQHPYAIVIAPSTKGPGWDVWGPYSGAFGAGYPTVITTVGDNLWWCRESAEPPVVDSTLPMKPYPHALARSAHDLFETIKRIIAVDSIDNLKAAAAGVEKLGADLAAAEQLIARFRVALSHADSPDYGVLMDDAAAFLNRNQTPAEKS